MAYFNNSKPKREEKPINENIKEHKMLVIDENGKKLGEFDKSSAIDLAAKKELDLVLIVPSRNNQLAICKITDYGKMLYQQKVNNRQKKRNQSVIKVKVIKLRPQIANNDLKWMVKNTIEWLNDNNQIKFKIKAYGRIGFKPELINEVYNKFLTMLGPVAKVMAPLKKLTPVLYEATIVKNK